MKHINNIVNLESFHHLKELDRHVTRSSETQTHSTENIPSSINAIKVWEAFTQIWGGNFVAQNSTTPPDIWIEELALLTPAQVDLGINQCKRLNSNFSPSLGVFLRLCDKDLGDTPEQKAFKAQCEAMAKNWGLPKPSNPEIRKAEIAKMKQVLIPSS